MSSNRITPTGVERTFGEDEIIVSKTDLKGRITYANDIFLKIADYKEGDVLGKPHQLIRHPDMPRAVFKILWDTIQSGRELFAYVKNMTAGGDHYWVFAHVTPTFDAKGEIVGYHSNRRVPVRAAIDRIEPVYARMLAAENAPGTGPGSAKTNMEASAGILEQVLRDAGMSYEEFVFSIAGNRPPVQERAA